jgi:phospholipid transport system substrate-binding protein
MKPLTGSRMFSIFLTLLLSSAAWGAPLTPGATLRQKSDELGVLLRQKIEQGSPAAEKQQASIRQVTDSLLGYEIFAEESLGEHWSTFARRDEFLAVFRAMLEKRYLRQVRASFEYGVIYESEIATGQEATVTTVVKRGADGRSIDEEVVYKLRRLGDNTWKVRDIITDEVSLVRNYKTQFHKIITEQGADKLIEKIKSKL